jgi:hypothetical protein
MMVIGHFDMRNEVTMEKSEGKTQVQGSSSKTALLALDSCILARH